MPDLRRISSASVLLVLVLMLGWAGAGIPRCGVTQFRSQTRHRPARPARVPVTSCPHPANQRPVSRPRPANHRPRFSRAPRCLCGGGGRGAGGAGNTAGRAAPGPRRPQSASCLRPRRTEHARGAARDRSAAAAAGGRAQPRRRGHRGRPHHRHQVCRV